MNTKTLKVRINCIAYYDAEIIVPDNLSLDEAIEYAKQNIDSISISELEWIKDTDIDEYMCAYEEEEI